MKGLRCMGWKTCEESVRERERDLLGFEWPDEGREGGRGVYCTYIWVGSLDGARLSMYEMDV